MSLTACYPGAPVVSASSAFHAGDSDYIAGAILGADDPRKALRSWGEDAKRADRQSSGDYARMVRLACRVAAWQMELRRVSTPQSREAQARKVDAQSIKESVDLVNYIDQHVRLMKAGSVFKAPCPFHDDKTPSFCVWPDGHWKCFGCQEGGDIFNFVMLWHKVDFKGAVKLLEEQGHGVTR